MPLTLGALKRNLRTLGPLDYAGEKVTFSYRPGEVTPALGSEMEEDKRPLVMALLRALVTWDVMEDDGKTPLELKEDVLIQLPTHFLNFVMNAIYKDTVEGKA